MITRLLLRSLRNDLPMPFTIQQMGSQAPYATSADGRCRFLCPYCHETQAVVNPKNNLAHCFHCAKNINNIDLLLATGHGFKDTVALLQRWLLLFQSEKAGPKTCSPPPNAVKKAEGLELIGALLRREIGNDRKVC
jgi:hypothetical protein